MFSSRIGRGNDYVDRMAHDVELRDDRDSDSTETRTFIFLPYMQSEQQLLDEIARLKGTPCLGSAELTTYTTPFVQTQSRVKTSQLHHLAMANHAVGATIEEVPALSLPPARSSLMASPSDRPADPSCAKPVRLRDSS